ncbi:MAG: outer membrane protein assembly factor, partial [Dechloromonas sp.]|nr:outer membrane protein assembly factor [Dechloromonas sp.]
MFARPVFFLTALLLAVATPLAAGELSLQAPDDIDELLAPYLPEEAGNTQRLQGTLSEILATEGYFAPTFEFTDTDDGLRLNLDPGPRTLVKTVTLSLDGPVAATTREELQRDWRLPVGQP